MHKLLVKIGLGVVLVIALILVVTSVAPAHPNSPLRDSRSAPTPTVTKFIPNNGPATGGTSVVVTVAPH
jgi:hypothetical protein